MSSKDTQDETNFPSAVGMQRWLEREITDIQKAAELRIKEATRFVGAYARGELSAEQAADRTYEYDSRWGDALPGGFRSQGLTDEEILTTIDNVRVKQGMLDKHVLERRKKSGTDLLR
jgi:hypothetical protein